MPTRCNRGRRVLLVLVVFLSVGSVLTRAGENLLKNHSFEQMNQEGSFPIYWGVNPAYKGECSVVRDAVFAHRGSVCMRLAKTPRRGQVALTQGRFKVRDMRAVTVSVWAKGKGDLYVFCYLYGQGAFLRSVASEAVRIDGEDWQRRSVNLTIPEEAGEPRRKVAKFALAFHIEKGPVWVDDAALYLGEPEEGQVSYFQPGRSPFLTAPYISVAPKIDGLIHPEEWQESCAVTGFRELGGPLADRQTTAYMAFDERNLYFAFRCPQKGKFREGERGRDIKFGHQMEAMEIWLQPPGKGWFQFVGVPAGGFLDVSSEKGEAWNARWRYGSKVKDIEETVGGILTFAKKIWTAEVAVPFEDLGVTAPREGETWRVNFCRDFSVGEGRNRTPSDWTTWSFIRGGFANSDMFGYARFSRETPAVQILQLGDVENGNLSIRGKLAGIAHDRPSTAQKEGAPNLAKVRNLRKVAAAEIKESRADIQSVVRMQGDDEKVILDRVESFSVSAGRVTDFTLADTLSVSSTTAMKLLLAIQDVSRNELIAQMEVPFTCVTSFQMKPIPVHSRGFVEVTIDASRVPRLPDRFAATVEIPDTGLSWNTEMSENKTKASHRFDISPLKPGDYLIRGSLKDSEGKIIASSSEPLPIPPKPVWLHNKIGLSEEVPPPWTPLKVKGNSAFFTEREYRLSDSGLPSQIVCLDKEVLAGPARIKAVVNDEEATWKFEPLKTIEENKQRAVWQVKGACGSLTLVGELSVEFDGFGLYRFKIAPAKEASLSSLVIEFPLKKDFALYARAARGLPPYKACYASLYENTFKSAKEVDMGEGGQWIYSPTWKWPATFFNEVWVGDDRSGLALMCETDENIKGKKYAEFLPEENATTLRLNLISEPVVLKKPLTYEYAYQATPARPQPKDPKRWHASYFATWPDDYLDRLYVACQYHLLAHTSYPKLYDPKQTARILKKPHEHGAKVVPDSHPAGAAVETPEFKLYGYEWEAIPRGGWSGLRDTVRVTCYASSYPDFMLNSVKTWVEDFNLDGIYIDSGTAACENVYHGCGYTDEEGKRRPTLPLWATREFYKRLYTYLHTGGRDGVIFSHTMHQTLVSGFQDVVTQGEEWCVEKELQYRRLSPDMFRAKEMRNQYGAPFTWYVFHQYSWRGDKYGGPVSFNEILAICLPHHVLPTVGDRVGGEEIVPIWDLFDQWWTTAEFIPYWDRNAPAKTKSETALASTYLKQDSALVVVANWNYDPAKIEVSFDWKRLGLEAAAVRIVDALGGEEVALKGGKVVVELPARDFKVLRLSSKK